MTSLAATSDRNADYGLDAPALVVGLSAGGGVLLLASLLVARFGGPSLRGLGGFAWMGASFALTGLAMWWSSRIGKLRARDRLFEALALEGNERVLDVGCGHGLLLLGAAKRVPQGRAVGLDLWQQRDQRDNRKEATLANARVEGVADRVEVHDGDMRAMPFPDATFDLVVSNIAIHNVPSAAERTKALKEIARVLKPGGRVALMDLAHTAEYARVLAEAGLVDLRRSGPSPTFFPPVRTVTGRKPG